jgi:hypothetical protein
LENDGSQSVDQSAADPVGDGGALSESLVTPEIEAKSAEVFGGGESGAGEASATARQRQADVEQQEELDEAAPAADAGSAAGDAPEQGRPDRRQRIGPPLRTVTTAVHRLNRC